MHNLYVIAGCNGAGKTTASFTVLPEMLECKEFVNADEIARGLSPFQPEKVAFEAGRIMLQRIKYLISHKENFAFETTLSSKSYLPILENARQNGYVITLIYFWLESIELAKSRVRDRVLKGGHDIPAETIERRYKRSLINLKNIYIPLASNIMVYNNSHNLPEIIASGTKKDEIEVYIDEIWNKISSIQ